MNLGRYDHLLEATRRKILSTPPAIFLLVSDNASALEKISRIVEQDPGNASSYVSRGNFYGSRLSDKAHALWDFSRAVELDSHLAVAFEKRGEAYLADGDSDKAIEDFSRLIELTPENASAYGERGNAYIKSGKSELAAGDFDREIRLAPADADGYIGRGKAQRLLGDRDGAAQNFRAAISLDPFKPVGYHFLARTFAGMDNLEDRYALPPEPPPFLLPALDALARILATHPNPKYRNGTEAVLLAEQSWALDGHHSPEILDDLASAYAEAGRFRDAVGAGQQAIFLARALGNQSLAEKIESRVKLYERNQAYHLPGKR